MGNEKDIIILGIESSCDDTAAAVLRNDKILANIVAGQEVHAAYGGVVPELASRAHQKHIVPVVSEALKAAGISPNELTGIAYTKGPGLLGSLLVGSSFAKSMAQGLGIPTIPVHHMKAHVLAHFIETGAPIPDFPFICLTVSGGHTQIVKVKSYQDFEIIGETLDDAAGEAFDKAAKLLGLPYPGGPIIDKNAALGNPHAFTFTRPKVDGYNFSFSGLKTNFRNFVERETRRNENFIEENMNDLCASLQYTIIEMLMDRLIAAADAHQITSIALAGGVSANKGLRNRLENEAQKKGWKTFIPAFEFCTDNAAMIGITGYYDFLANHRGSLEDAATARWKM